MTTTAERMSHKDRMKRRKTIAQYVRRMIREGATNPVRKAAAGFGVSVFTVYEALREHGVDLKTDHNRLGRTTYHVLALLITTDRPLTQIAREFGVSHTRIKQISAEARAAGVPVKVRKRGNKLSQTEED